MEGESSHWNRHTHTLAAVKRCFSSRLSEGRRLPQPPPSCPTPEPAGAQIGQSQGLAVRMAQLATEIIIALIWIPLCSLSNRRANPVHIKAQCLFRAGEPGLAAIVGQPPRWDRCLGIAAHSVSHCGKKKKKDNKERFCSRLRLSPFGCAPGSI